MKNPTFLFLIFAILYTSHLFCMRREHREVDEIINLLKSSRFALYGGSRTGQVRDQRGNIYEFIMKWCHPIVNTNDDYVKYNMMSADSSIKLNVIKIMSGQYTDRFFVQEVPESEIKEDLSGESESMFNQAEEIFRVH